MVAALPTSSWVRNQVATAAAARRARLTQAEEAKLSARSRNMCPAVSAMACRGVADAAAADAQPNKRAGGNRSTLGVSVHAPKQSSVPRALLKGGVLPAARAPASLYVYRSSTCCAPTLPFTVPTSRCGPAWVKYDTQTDLPAAKVPSRAATLILSPFDAQGWAREAGGVREKPAKAGREALYAAAATGTLAPPLPDRCPSLCGALPGCAPRARHPQLRACSSRVRAARWTRLPFAAWLPTVPWA